MKKIRPCLWLDHNVKDAIDFYTSVFKNSRVFNTSYYPEDALCAAENFFWLRSSPGVGAFVLFL